jgi:hypothetical protein
MNFTDRLAWVQKCQMLQPASVRQMRPFPRSPTRVSTWVALGPLGAYGKAPEAPASPSAGAFLCPERPPSRPRCHGGTSTRLPLYKRGRGAPPHGPAGFSFATRNLFPPPLFLAV